MSNCAASTACSCGAGPAMMCACKVRFPIRNRSPDTHMRSGPDFGNRSASSTTATSGRKAVTACNGPSLVASNWKSPPADLNRTECVDSVNEPWLSLAHSRGFSSLSIPWRLPASMVTFDTFPPNSLVEPNGAPVEREHSPGRNWPGCDRDAGPKGGVLRPSRFATRSPGRRQPTSPRRCPDFRCRRPAFCRSRRP